MIVQTVPGLALVQYVCAVWSQRLVHSSHCIAFSLKASRLHTTPSDLSLILPLYLSPAFSILYPPHSYLLSFLLPPFFPSSLLLCSHSSFPNLPVSFPFFLTPSFPFTPSLSLTHSPSIFLPLGLSVQVSTFSEFLVHMVKIPPSLSLL